MSAAANEQGPAYWAAIEHHRTWLASDGAYRKEVRHNGLSLDLARQIVRDYRVARTVKSLKDHRGKSASSLPQLLKAILACEWKDGLVSRAELCIEVAGRFADSIDTEKKPISAVTKLMWFLRPDGWTMYDQFARKGLIGNRHDPKQFYRKLDELKFEEVSRRLKQACLENGFNDLYGERIIDKFLMLRGAGNASAFGGSAAMMNKHYLELLPSGLAGQLKELAKASACILESSMPSADAPSRTG